MRRFQGVLRAAVVAITGAVLLIIAGAPAFATTTDEAPADVQITMSPTSVDVDIVPGATFEGEMVVINSGTEPFRFSVYAQPYSVTNAEYDPDFSTESARTQIARWVSFDADSYVTEPGEEITVPYRIAVPEDVPDGGQYAVLFAETEPEEDASGVATTRRVGMLVYASVPGTTREEASVRRDDPSVWQLSNSVAATETVANSGNTDFTTTVRYRLLDLFGGVVDEQEQVRAVLPETDRAFTFDFTTAPVGVYTLERSTTLPGGDEADSRTVIVTHPAAVIVVGVLLLLIVLTLVLTRRRKRAVA